MKLKMGKHELRELVTLRGAEAGFRVGDTFCLETPRTWGFSMATRRFDQERNRLGGLLLLKGKDNISRQ